MKENLFIGKDLRTLQQKVKFDKNSESMLKQIEKRQEKLIEKKSEKVLVEKKSEKVLAEKKAEKILTEKSMEKALEKKSEKCLVETNKTFFPVNFVQHDTTSDDRLF